MRFLGVLGRFGVVDLSGFETEITRFRRNPMLQAKSYDSGEVLRVNKSANTLVVEGINISKKPIKNSPNVYSTGGGIVLNKQNRLVLKKNGYTIFLNASIPVLYNRIKNDANQRPLFKNKNMLEKLLNQRIHYYRDCANFVVDTDNETPQEIVRQIINQLNHAN